MVADVIRNIRKDFRVEFRNRSALNISVAFAGISTLAISLATGGVRFSATLQSVMLWIIMFFSAMNGLAHIFVREEEERTSLFLTLNASLDAIFASKLVFNGVFFMVLQAIVTPLFVFFIQVEVHAPLPFVLTVLAGGIAISSATTILGAMVSKAGGKGSLFTVISFPVLLPVLWIAIATSARCFEPGEFTGWGNVLFFLAFSCVIIILSFLLFRHIWIEE